MEEEEQEEENDQTQVSRVSACWIVWAGKGMPVEDGALFVSSRSQRAAWRL